MTPSHRPAAHPLRLAAFALLAVAASAAASLKPGAQAPTFTAQASLGGQVSTFVLADALKRGPVALYFYPAAFTSGCTVEAHDFADAIDRFKAMGATVIGISHDDIDTLNKFSVSECRSKFPVAADTDQLISKSYEATMWFWPGHSNRTSYLIAPDGTILFTYSALSPGGHVKGLLAALKEWRDKQTAPTAPVGASPAPTSSL